MRGPGPDPRPARNQPGGPSLAPRIPLAEARPAMFGYLAAIFLGPLIPLVLYMIGRRRSPFRRFHAAMALNLSLTGLLYALCCLILAGLLLLDSLTAALVVVIPVALVIWLWQNNTLFDVTPRLPTGVFILVPGGFLVGWFVGRLAHLFFR